MLARWAGPSLNWVLADRSGAIALGRQRPAAAPRRLRRLAARVARRRQPLVARPAAAAGRARRPRRRAVHGQQPHAAARARRRREPHVDAAAARQAHRRAARGAAARSTSATSSRCSSTRAPKATSRFARRFSRSSSPTSASRSSRERASSREAWNGHADVDQAGVSHAARVLPRARSSARSSRCWRPAIAADPSFVYRWPLADEVLRRLLDERPAHFLTSEHADWRAFLRAVLLDTLAALDARRRRSTRRGAKSTCSTSRIRSRGAGAARAAGSRCRARRCRARWCRCEWRRRATAPCCGWRSRPRAPEDGVLQLAGGQSGHFLSPQFRDQQADWVDGTPTPFLAGEPVARFMLVP